MKEARSVGIVETKYFTFAHPPDELVLESGERLGPITLAYETYGELNSDKSNAILILHALSGDAHAAGYHSPEDIKPGWWDPMIGPGKAFDTEQYFVICSNVLGGCKGSTGPSSINPKTGRPYGLEFPIITIKDMVNAQKRLIEHLGIEQLLSVAGGSMGGFQALQWAVSYPDAVKSVIAIATAARQSAQGIAFDEVGRRAIMSDPNWMNGDYYGKAIPKDGLALARMIGHITYLSEESMHEKFGRNLHNSAHYSFTFNPDFEVESYLYYKGDSFVKRFDANSYLYITKAIDYFDITEGTGNLVEAFKRVKAKFLVISFSSDWLYPPAQSKEIVRALKANNVDVTYFEIKSKYGHDAFLVEFEQQTRIIKNFLHYVMHPIEATA
ncbi:MAG: homoserine O-acetyltransferase [Candidatus Methanomethyliaceae archaeon]